MERKSRYDSFYKSECLEVILTPLRYTLISFAGESNQYYQQPPPQMRQQPPQSHRNELNYGMRELRYKVAASAAARK
jgi:hypothetical protein